MSGGQPLSRVVRFAGEHLGDERVGRLFGCLGGERLRLVSSAGTCGESQEDGYR